MVDSTTKIFNINSKQKIVPALDSRSNSQITYDCVECIRFQNQYQQRQKWPRVFTKKRELCRTINDEYNLGITTLLPKARHLIYAYYENTLFQIKFGRQRDWIKQIQLTRKEFLSDVQPITQPQPRINNSVRAWLITGTANIADHSDNDESLSAKRETLADLSHFVTMFEVHPRLPNLIYILIHDSKSVTNGNRPCLKIHSRVSIFCTSPVKIRWTKSIHLSKFYALIPVLNNNY